MDLMRMVLVRFGFVTRNGTSGRDIEPVISSVPLNFPPPVMKTMSLTINRCRNRVEQTSTAPAVESGKGIWKDVYVINITARDGSYIYGRDLKHALRILGFRFGEMDMLSSPSGNGWAGVTCCFSPDQYDQTGHV